ncbi:putative B3 domain-containing protein At5g58280 [Mercurialis annua]|uniref:putative B3 domain-containing protein At5g58280 n=1 Tax=Mercurialis annua TaxID=3986 RepID=UPI00215DF605|nr:putative B3 domain-containing protein At5g58280 [Mercurialis annua]
MARENDNGNTYEEARKLRLEENKKRFKDLGISNLTESLSNLTSPEKKTKQRLSKPKSAITELIEPRRSTRTRNPIISYGDDVDFDERPLRKRSKSSSSSWTSYIARPLNEVKLASYEDRTRALSVAREFESNLQSGNPSFVKSMVRSHVYSCFWLGLPTDFCKHHLPKKDSDLILEDENGAEYDAKYLAQRTGLSGGWRAFALDHKLDDGDAVVFELVEKHKLKVYAFRIRSPQITQNGCDAEEEDTKTESIEKNECIAEEEDNKTDFIEQNDLVAEENKKEKSGREKKADSVDKEAKQKGVKKARKKPEPKLFRRK